MNPDEYFASERYAAYLEWIATANDYPVITLADGTQVEHPYRDAAWLAFVETTED
jgi:hypothetical protein